MSKYAYNPADLNHDGPRPQNVTRAVLPIDIGPKHGGLVRKGNRLPPAAVNHKRPENQK